MHSLNEREKQHRLSQRKKADFPQNRQTNTFRPCRALQKMRRDVRTNIFVSLPPFFFICPKTEREPFYRNCRIGSLQAMTHRRHNDTPALNASRHWAAGREPCRVPATMYEIHCASPWSAAGAVCICCNYICNSVLAVFHKMYYLFLTGGI